MKVLLVHCFYRSSAPSGEDSVYRNEKQLLIDNGFEVITYEKHNDDLDNTSSAKKMMAGLDYIWSDKALVEISDIIIKHKPQIAHFHNIFPQLSSSVYLACKNNNVPVVQTLHNFRYICPSALLQREGKPCEKCLDHSLFNSLIHKCYRNSYIATLPLAAMIAFNRYRGYFTNNVDKYIALTEFAKTRFIRGGLPEKKISIKPNFVSHIEKSTVPLGNYAVYIGRLTQEKGVKTLIEACKKMKHIPLKVVGDGELRSQLESTCIQFDLNVEFLGQQNKENVMSIIKSSRLVVLPSECYEGFPVTIAEAYACGKPVVGTKIGSLDEIIIENITGKKFEFGSSDSLVNTLTEIWQNSLEIQLMSENARKEYEEKYNAETNIKILSAIYREAIEQALFDKA